MTNTKDNSNAAVLLLHGFGGQPFEMRGLEGVLREAGYAVSVPLLPGHGTTVEDWCRTDFADWAEAAEDAYRQLAATHERVFVAGLSMGGSLALHIAERFSPAGVVTIAAPMFLYSLYPFAFTDWRLPFVPLLKKIRPLWPTSHRRPEAEAIAPWRGYDGVMALEPLDSLLKGMRSVRARLEDVTAPLLVLHAHGDRTVPQENAWDILTKVNSSDKRLVLFPIEEGVTSRHVLTTHRETKCPIERLVLGFAERVLNGNG